MTFWVYILESLKNGRRYIGTSSNSKKRLEQHNLGKTRSTKPYIPYKIIHLEKFETKKQALIRERKLKSYKGGEALKKLIK